MKFGAGGVAVFGLVLGVAFSARAADIAFPAERLRPAMDRTGIIDVESGEVLGFFEYDVAVWLDYARNPLVLYRKSGDSFERAGTLVQNRVGAHLVGALSLFWVQVGVQVPITLYQDRGESASLRGAAKLDAVGLGDLALVPKVQLLRADQLGFDLAALATVTVPTAVPKDSYNGERTASLAPELAISMPAKPMRVAANLGYRLRKNSELLNLDVADEITYRAAAALDLEDLIAAPLEVAIGLSGATPAAKPFGRFNANPLELLLEATYADLPMSLQGFVGLGAGLVAGYGTPDVRVFAGIRYAQARPDRDGDGVDDASDKCPNEPEDKDGFEDADGCRDVDNDGDKVLDEDDDCPMTAGPSENGCPEHVTVGGTKLEFGDRVYFATSKSTIEARSHKLLDEVATVLNANPQIIRMEIEGHTDDQGDAEDNRVLSQDRADSVRRYLIAKGVAKERLDAKGYGEAKPIAPNTTERGRARNRRVEFTIKEGQK